MNSFVLKALSECPEREEFFARMLDKKASEFPLWNAQYYAVLQSDCANFSLVGMDADLAKIFYSRIGVNTDGNSDSLLEATLHYMEDSSVFAKRLTTAEKQIAAQFLRYFIALETLLVVHLYDFSPWNPFTHNQSDSTEAFDELCDCSAYIKAQEEFVQHMQQIEFPEWAGHDHLLMQLFELRNKWYIQFGTFLLKKL